jgi:hypothetical protein
MMPDDRQDSTAEGITPAPESEIGRAADQRRVDRVIHAPEEARPESTMGGTSDSDNVGDEPWIRPNAD